MPQIIELTHRTEFWTQQVSTRTKPWTAALCYWMFSIRDNKSINTWRQLKANRASNCVVYLRAWPGWEFRVASWTEWLTSVGGRRDLRDRKVVPWWIIAADLHRVMTAHQACFYLLSICQPVHLDTTWAFCSGSQHALRKSWEVLNLNRAVADGGFQ